jgi:hypothetical protein
MNWEYGRMVPTTQSARYLYLGCTDAPFVRDAA